jgi:hypothetical protein
LNLPMVHRVAQRHGDGDGDGDAVAGGVVHAAAVSVRCGERCHGRVAAAQRAGAVPAWERGEPAPEQAAHLAERPNHGGGRDACRRGI